MPLPPPPLVIGVLGGIASGKSWVAQRLCGPEGVLIDADAIARAVLHSPEVRSELRQVFGPAIETPAGELDREALAARVFSDRSAKERLESFTHPRIRARIRARLEEARAGRVPRIVLDVPLLLENEASHGLAEQCHELVFVDSDPAQREARAIATRGWKPGEVARREALQLPLEAKRARAKHCIANFGDLAALARATDQCSAQLNAPPRTPSDPL